MISLDKKILDPTSAVARRMIEYGKKDELFILIPNAEAKKTISLSNTVRVYSTGGNKLQQYFQLKRKGLQLMRDHDIKFITVQDPSFSGHIGCWLKKKTGATLEIQIHGDFYGSDYYKKNLKDFISYFLLARRNIRAADRVRVVGERVKKSILALGIDESKIITRSIPLWQGDEERAEIHKKDYQEDFSGDYEKYFLFVGRLEKVKNLEWLIDIFSEVVQKHGKNYRLLIVGDGSQKEYLQNLVSRQNLEKNVKFKEWMDIPSEYYERADCLLQPSVSESYSMVVMEAVAAGCPVIMNDVGVANYEVQPSEKVKILPINDREKWIQAILSI